MNPAQVGMLSCLALMAAWFVWVWRWQGRLQPRSVRRAPSPFELVLGFITNFFDTLGIGSFAPTTAAFRLRRLMPDEEIPGSLNIGHALPSIAQALIFIAAVQVGPVLLVSMIGASALGAWLGAGFVIGFDRRRIQLGIGLALIVAAILFTAVNLGLLPGGGTALDLDGWRFWLALAANFVFGGLMTLGVGIYGPCLITLALLGMNPIAAFPIMMGSSALLMPIASFRFLRSRRYALGAAIGLTVGGIPGVLLAAYVVKSLPLVALRWLVVVAVTFVAISLLRAAFGPQRAAASSSTGSASTLP